MVRKKSTPKKTATTYKRCATPKCRRKAKDDSDLCAKCYDSVFPTETVQRLTVVEALQFSSMDTEIRNHAQGVRILDLEAVQDHQNFQVRQQDRESRKAQLQAAINAKKAEYTAFVETLATKYNVDIQNMTIDPESRIIRDLSTESSSATNT